LFNLNYVLIYFRSDTLSAFLKYRLCHYFAPSPYF